MVFFKSCSVVLLIAVISVPSYVAANPMNVYDVETCLEMCEACGGEPYVEDESCECYFDESDESGSMCMSRLRRQAEEFELEQPSYDLYVDRAPRCSPMRRRFGMLGNGDQFANYFMNGLPTLGLANPLAPPSEAVVGSTIGGPSQSDALVGVTNEQSDPAIVTAPQPHYPVYHNYPYRHNFMLGAPNQYYRRNNYQDSAQANTGLVATDDDSEVVATAIDASPVVGSKQDTDKQAEDEADEPKMDDTVLGNARIVESDVEAPTPKEMAN